MRIQTFLVSVCTATLALACGGDDSTIAGPDGSIDGTTDGSMGTDGEGIDTGINDAGSDTSMTTDGGGACTPDAGRAACAACCASEQPTGATVFAGAAEKCACVPELCGPTDGGVDAGKVFGHGDCDMTCGSAKPPDGKCFTCLTDAIGTMGTPGPCFSDVQTACLASAPCVAYVTCLMGCK